MFATSKDSNINKAAEKEKVEIIHIQTSFKMQPLRQMSGRH